MEKVFETFETSDIYTTTTSAPNMIDFFKQKIWKRVLPSEWSQPAIQHTETYMLSESIQTITPIKKLLTYIPERKMS